MPSSFAATLALAVGLLTVEANRVQIAYGANASDIDWDAVTYSVKAVNGDRENDRFVVFASRSEKELQQIALPETKGVSLAKFKEALLSCGPKGSICMGYYKFNYPLFVGSSTLKGKSILVLAKDESTVGMRVNMPVTMFVWKPLKDKLHEASVSVATAIELSSLSSIEEFSADSAWDAIASKTTRVSSEEIESFKKHADERNAATLDLLEASTTLPGTSAEMSVGDAGKALVGPAEGVDARVVEELVDQKLAAVKAQLVQELGSLVQEKAEKMARATAQDEVGRALRLLGSKVGEAFADVGKMWIDKASAH